MNETFEQFMPVAEPVLPDLVRLDRRGRATNVEVRSDQAPEQPPPTLEESG